MRIIACSLNDLTAEFQAAVAALRYAGHIIDVYRKRGFGESLHGYTAAMISLGDWTGAEAMHIKLAAARAAATLPACYFLDRPPFRWNSEDFWRSAMFSESANETASQMQHRSEMLGALKSDWRPKIEAVVERWNDHESLPCIWPGRDWITGPFQTPPDTSLSMPGPSATRLSSLFINKVRENKVTSGV